MRLEHAYPERRVQLSMWIVERFAGVPRGLDGQELKWVAAAQLHSQDLLEADRPFVDTLARLARPASGRSGATGVYNDRS
jgi:8-oxo-dGTP diphosphatase